MGMLKGNKIRNVAMENNNMKVAEMVKNNFIHNKVNQKVKMNVQFVKNGLLLSLQKYNLETDHARL